MNDLMNILLNYHIEIWAITGLILIIIEMFILPSVGSLFIGLGALSVAILEIISDKFTNFQFEAFISFSIIWVVILWKPMQNLYSKNHSTSPVNDLIGSKVRVLNNDILPNTTGEIEWSGTIMKAFLESAAPAKIGTYIKVVSIKGNLLICKLD